jgi:deoxyribonuclease-4
VKDHTVGHFLRFGLKLYSTDTSLISAAQSLEEGHFQYVELYVVPGTFRETIRHWKSFNIPYVIHAPHSSHGVNLARREHRTGNRIHMGETRAFADALGASTIIVHGGNNGFLSECIYQIRMLGDKRIVIENKPKIGLRGELCIGWSPADFHVIASAGLLHGVVLDFAHAACAARSEGIDEMGMIESFLAFHPIVFHLSDGDATSEKDTHLNLGEGDRDLGFYVGCVPPGGYITLETPRNPATGFDDFVRDVAYLSSLLRKLKGSKETG